MNSLIENITDIATKKKRRSFVIDNLFFRLHYRVTTIFLLACAMLVTSKQLFGDPITCTVSTKKKVPAELLNTFCWAHTTFSVNTAWTSVVGDQIIYPGVDNSHDRSNLVHHVYYQWVAIVLFIQAFFFYLPHLLWKSMYGRKIVDMVPKQLMGEAEDEDDRDKGRLMLALNLLKHRRRSNRVRYCYIIAESLSLLNVVVQIYSTDRFLGGNFLLYGLSILHHSDWGFSSHYNPMLRIFPRMTKCTFYHYGDSGDVAKDDALCILPVNVINEKVYLLLWFWLYFLLLVSSVNTLYQLATLICRPLTTKYLRSHCSARSYEAIGHLTQDFSSGDIFILTLIRKNIDRVVFEDLLSDLSANMTYASAEQISFKNREEVHRSQQNGYIHQTPV